MAAFNSGYRTLLIQASASEDWMRTACQIAHGETGIKMFFAPKVFLEDCPLQGQPYVAAPLWASHGRQSFVAIGSLHCFSQQSRPRPRSRVLAISPLCANFKRGELRSRPAASSRPGACDESAVLILMCMLTTIVEQQHQQELATIRGTAAGATVPSGQEHRSKRRCPHGGDS